MMKQKVRHSVVQQVCAAVLDAATHANIQHESEHFKQFAWMYIGGATAAAEAFHDRVDGINETSLEIWEQFNQVLYLMNNGAPLEVLRDIAYGRKMDEHGNAVIPEVLVT